MFCQLEVVYFRPGDLLSRVQSGLAIMIHKVLCLSSMSRWLAFLVCLRSRCNDVLVQLLNISTGSPSEFIRAVELSANHTRVYDGGPLFG